MLHACRTKGHGWRRKKVSYINAFAISGGQWYATSLFAFDHRLAAQFAKIVLGLGLELFAEDLVARLALFGGVGLGFLFLAQGEHLNALRRRLRRGQMPDLGLVEDLPQGGHELGGILGDRLADSDIAQRTRKQQ